MVPSVNMTLFQYRLAYIASVLIVIGAPTASQGLIVNNVISVYPIPFVP